MYAHLEIQVENRALICFKISLFLILEHMEQHGMKFSLIGSWNELRYLFKTIKNIYNIIGKWFRSGRINNNILKNIISDMDSNGNLTISECHADLQKVILTNMWEYC